MDSFADFFKILYMAGTAFAYLFIMSKLMGKRQIAELDFINYVIGISVGSIAAEMATDLDDKPFYLYLISMSIFFLLDFLLTFLSRKSRFLEHFIIGSSLILIEDGKINFKMLKKSRLNVNELLGLAREQGYFDITDIMYGIFETNGTLSIMPKSEKSPVTAGDIKLKKEKASFNAAVITDGQICKNSLKILGKDKTWLMGKIGLTKKELKDVVLASYNENTKKFEIQYKNKS